MATMRKVVILELLVLSTVSGARTIPAQQAPPIDPTRTLAAVPPAAHAPLPEQYVWTADDVTARQPDHNKYPWSETQLRIAPHYFRIHFRVKALPSAATLYVAGPREAHVFLNGNLLADSTPTRMLPLISIPSTPTRSRAFEPETTLSPSKRFADVVSSPGQAPLPRSNSPMARSWSRS